MRDQAGGISLKSLPITGCSSGLGRALAQRLAAERPGGSPAYQVYASARSKDSLKELEAEGIRTVQLDVTSQKSVDAAVKKVVQEAGRIDLLINNAGKHRVGPIVEQPMAEVEEVMAANYFGVVRVTQAVAPHMIRQRSGLIVMIGSVVSLMATPFGAAYSASKAALLALSDSLRLELRPFKVHVTYVVAGSIKQVLLSVLQHSVSSFSDNIARGVQVQRYERPSSLYAPLADMIRSRVEMSQDPKTAMPAAAAADEIAAVVNASLLPTAEPAGVADYALNKLLDLGGWAVSALGGGSSDGGASIGAPSTGAPSTAGSIDGDSVAEGPPVWRARPPPGWFLAGGNARQFWLIGVAQKLLPSGWPSNGLLAKKFGLSRPLQ
ncbi:hypothetical protein ABPG77_002604 [Micractinium sp. CCAP 211/92]